MTKDVSFDTLWRSAPFGQRSFQSAQVSNLPPAARQYLEHAIAPGTPLASAVHLRMHGEIKLRRWLPFTAEQVIRWDRGMIWSATVRLSGLSIKGFDRLIDGEGAMRWKWLGLFPVMTAAGPDITRSAIGRVQAETVWLPSVLCGDEMAWTAHDSTHAQARFAVQGRTAALALTLDGQGRLVSVKLRRWGNPEGARFHEVDFGGVVEQEGTFSGYTIPTRLRIGWYFDSGQFDADGEFFRVTIDEALYRIGAIAPTINRNTA